MVSVRTKAESKASLNPKSRPQKRTKNDDDDHSVDDVLMNGIEQKEREGRQEKGKCKCECKQTTTK